MFSFVYQIANKIDKYFKEKKKIYSSIPIVSVGNLSTGGSGKSQVVKLLLQNLQNEFYVLVLTKGYNRKSRIDFNSNLNQPSIEICGDEPMMLLEYLKNGALLISENRAKYLQENEKNFNKLNSIVILDDGFQHYCLNRNCDILLIDDITANQHKTLPFGRLREKPDQVNRANIFLYQSIKGLEFLKKYCDDFNDDVCFKYETMLNNFEQNGQEVKLDMLDDLYLFTSIANPQRVVNLLNANGFKKIEHKIFPDHYNYYEKDVNQILSQSHGKKILTTEKDYPKLKRFENIKNRLIVIKTDLKISDKEKFINKVKQCILAKQYY